MHQNRNFHNTAVATPLELGLYIIFRQATSLTTLQIEYLLWHNNQLHNTTLSAIIKHHVDSMLLHSPLNYTNYPSYTNRTQDDLVRKCWLTSYRVKVCQQIILTYSIDVHFRSHAWTRNLTVRHLSGPTEFLGIWHTTWKGVLLNIHVLA